LNFLIRLNEIILSTKVTTNSISPKANAERVSGELNSKSPTREFTIVTVTVVISSNGFQDKFGLSPAAITTIIVSPIAFEKPRIQAEMIPGRAEGNTIFLIVSPWVIPRPSEAFLCESGTALITSSDNDEITGIIIIPITTPDAKAELKVASSPIAAAPFTISGATVIAAKKPYTTVGIPARTSNIGFKYDLVSWEAYSLIKTALPSPIGIATSIAMNVIIIVPAKIGIAPNLLPVIPGDHSVPVKKYQKLLSSKKAIASNRIEKRIPKVVRIDITEAVINAPLIRFSFNSVDLFLDSNECKSTLYV